MAEIITFRPRIVAAVPVACAIDRARYRASIETATEICLDIANRLVGLLDRLDGDPDFEPDADGEDSGEAEPALAALVGAVSQIRWVGFDGGGAA